jgi:hypothetical protein
MKMANKRIEKLGNYPLKDKKGLQSWNWEVRL